MSDSTPREHTEVLLDPSVTQPVGHGPDSLKYRATLRATVAKDTPWTEQELARLTVDTKLFIPGYSFMFVIEPDDGDDLLRATVQELVNAFAAGDKGTTLGVIERLRTIVPEEDR
jgi:hypothetical protein